MIVAAGVEIWLEALGLRIRIRTPDRGLAGAIRCGYGAWRTPPAAGPPDIEIDLSPACEAELCEPVVAVEGSRLKLSGGGVSGAADAASRQGWCRVPASLRRQPARLAAEVVDTLLLFLIARAGRTPVHASGVLFGGRAAVLAGPSGSGKSTLALAAMQRGFRILSDDTLYIQLRPGMRVWGFPRPLHLFPEDAPGFTDETRLRGGKLKVVAPLAPGAWAPFADDAQLVLLERGADVRLVRIDPREAAARLSALEPGFDLLQRESAAAVEALAARGTWRLTLGAEPGPAIEALQAHLSAGA